MTIIIVAWGVVNGNHDLHARQYGVAADSTVSERTVAGNMGAEDVDARHYHVGRSANASVRFGTDDDERFVVGHRPNANGSVIGSW